jgi:4-aminobutyrate aminotransferase-like enzyme
VGLDFWAYRTCGVVPDMVTLAKSMGNGVPVGGVVARAAVAASFDNQGMEYFSTCGAPCFINLTRSEVSILCAKEEVRSFWVPMRFSFPQ